MAARRNKVAPYEIMGRISRAEAPPEPAPSRPQAHAAPSSTSGGEPAAWWSVSGAGVPVVLRVPRGVAVLATAALLGLIVLAYWVGYQRGESAAVASEPTLDPVQIEQRDNQVPAGFPMASSSDPQPTPERAGAAAGAEAADPSTEPENELIRDPRQPGMVYLRVATWPLDACRDLAAFLDSRGVDTFLVPHGDGRRYRIYCLPGVASGNSEAQQRFREQVFEIGKKYREMNGGGPDLSDAYWST